MTPLPEVVVSRQEILLEAGRVRLTSQYALLQESELYIQRLRTRPTELKGGQPIAYRNYI